jgi:hypothetical protein
VHRPLDREDLGRADVVAVLAAVDREPEAVGARRVRELEVADAILEILGVALLQTQDIDIVVFGQGPELADGSMFPQVVTDDVQFAVLPEGITLVAARRSRV